MPENLLMGETWKKNLRASRMPGLSKTEDEVPMSGDTDDSRKNKCCLTGRVDGRVQESAE